MVNFRTTTKIYLKLVKLKCQIRKYSINAKKKTVKEKQLKRHQNMKKRCKMADVNQTINNIDMNRLNSQIKNQK